MYMATATHAQFEAKCTQVVTLAGQLERSAQIPLPTLIAIGHEVQTKLDQCERLASKSPQLESEHEVVTDLVIGYDLALAQNQPKLTRPAPIPQLESIGRRQRQYRVERKVPVSTDHFSLEQQRHGCKDRYPNAV